MTDDFIVYGICPDCRYAYTEPIDQFENWLPPGCPRCKTTIAPYPITEDKLPAPPTFYGLTPQDAFEAPKDWLLLLLLKDLGYRLGAWVGREYNGTACRNFAVGGSALTLSVEMITAAWRIGDRK